MRTLFTEKLPVTPRQIENDPDGRSRPPATQRPRSLDLNNGGPDLRRRNTTPQPKTT
ncbi:unnamed protein product [Brassica oleracea var. botrytis]